MVVMWHVSLGHDKQVEFKKNKTNKLVEKKSTRKNLHWTQIMLVIVFGPCCIRLAPGCCIHLFVSFSWVLWVAGVQIESGGSNAVLLVAVGVVWQMVPLFFLRASMTKWSMCCHRVYKQPQNKLLYLPLCPILM